MKKVITSESVNCGHPDKTCDIIADSFLDEALKQDPFSQMAVECAIKNNKLFIYGEATTKAILNYDKIAKDVLKEIGYDCDFEIIKELSCQSPDINRAVVKDKIMANDQGIVYGYATNENQSYMPYPIIIAHDLMREYEDYRKKDNRFKADAKSQVTVEYEDDKPIKILCVLVSVSHIETINYEDICKIIRKNVIGKVLKKYKNLNQENLQVVINPSKRFVTWGSFSDSGCVGRKIVVDTYGGVGRIGGGCFSSKNASKVDRSGAYYARYVAKNIVANQLADRCEVSVSYAIGLDQPLSINIETFGTQKIELEKIYTIVKNNFNFSPQNMIDELELLKPIYKETACYGHFGNAKYSWESIKNLKL